ncbi:MAG: hypothetical protein IT373_00300 [Polyangiaceae bacterium]|nr:hypothetical protein [Polyangiaceae bacterium]
MGCGVLGTCAYVACASGDVSRHGVPLAVDAGRDGDATPDAGPPPCVPPAATAWSPTEESCWAPVKWTHSCYVEYAEQPWLAAPRLAWEPCRDLPEKTHGCRQMKVDWPVGNLLPLWFNASVVRDHMGYRVGMQQIWQLPESEFGRRRAVVFDRDGTPLFAMRHRDDNCDVGTPILGREKVWLQALSYGDGVTLSQTYLQGRYDELADLDDAAVVPFHTLSLNAQGNDSFLLVQLESHQVVLFDQLTDAFGLLHPPCGGLGKLLPVRGRDGVGFVPCVGGSVTPNVAMWARENGSALVGIVDAPGVVTLGIGSDGDTIAWIRTSIGDMTNSLVDEAELWTSPFATTPGGLVPAKRVLVPHMPHFTLTPVAVGGGYVAFVASLPPPNDGDLSLHVYRLSDLRHWRTFLGRLGHVPEVTYLDGDEVWFHLFEDFGGLYRQRLDALGPGEPG